MPRIKIKDLPKDRKISEAEMASVMGGPEYLSQAVLPQGQNLVKPGSVQYMGQGGYAMYGSGFGYPYGGGQSFYGGFTLYG